MEFKAGSGLDLVNAGNSLEFGLPGTPWHGFLIFLDPKTRHLEFSGDTDHRFQNLVDPGT